MNCNECYNGKIIVVTNIMFSELHRNIPVNLITLECPCGKTATDLTSEWCKCDTYLDFKMPLHHSHSSR